MTTTSGADLFGGLPADEDRLAMLATRLSGAAEDADILDVGYVTMPSPVGQLLLAATASGLVRVAFEVEGFDTVLQSLADRISPRILVSAERLAPVQEELTEYFAGARRRFDLPLDFRLSHGFRREVLDQLTGIEYGHTASYAAIAAGTGSPRAVRAVGSACAANPLPLIVPCHRVVRSDGTIGQYLGGTEAKRRLLALEAA